MTTGTPEVRPLRSSRTRSSSSQNSTPTIDRDRTVSRRSEPSSRTALIGEQPKPLGRTTAPGCDEPTSRCQTGPSMWTLGPDKPVIPGVAFIRWALTIPQCVRGSLSPTFVSAQLVSFTVKLAYAFTLSVWFPSKPSQPLNASVTL